MGKNNDQNSLAHTKWRCQYHIVFAPKYRRRVIYGKYKQEIGKMIRTVCERNGVEILEASGSHLSVGEHTAQDGSVKLHGDIERKNESDDI